MTELIFYTNPMSRGRIVRWALEEAGIDYQTRVLEFGTEMKSGDYLAINPMGKVPAVSYGDQIVTEAAAICAWLADTFPSSGLAPEPQDRAAYYRWLFFAAGPVEQAVTARALGLEASPEQARTVGCGSYEDVLAALESAVTTNPFIAGDHFTVADVYVGGQIGFGLQFGTIEKRAALEAYWEKICNRAARLRAEEADNALMS